MSNETPSINRYNAKSMRVALACKRASFCCKFPLRKTSSTLRSVDISAYAVQRRHICTHMHTRMHKQQHAHTPICASILSVYQKFYLSACPHTTICMHIRICSYTLSSVFGVYTCGIGLGMYASMHVHTSCIEGSPNCTSVRGCVCVCVRVCAHRTRNVHSAASAW